MNRLVKEIKECMSGLAKSTDGQLYARFIFPADFIGFQGHFPERPILPGVCKIQAVLAMLEEWNKKRVKLNEIVMAKFAAPVTCDETVVFQCTETMEDNNKTLVKASVMCNDKNIAKIQLKVTFENENRGADDGSA